MLKRQPGRPASALSAGYVLGGRSVDVRQFRKEASTHQKKLFEDKIKLNRKINQTIREVLKLTTPESKILLLEGLLNQLKTTQRGQNVA